MDRRRLVALGDDLQGPVASLRTEILRVRAACFADPQPIEPQQDREPYVVAVVALLSDEEHAKLRPVHVPRRRRVHAWASEVLVGVGGGSSIDVGESEEAAHHGQAPIHLRSSETAIFEPAAVLLDVHPCTTLRP